MYLLLHGIKLFATPFGLKANPSKSELYSCGLIKPEYRESMKVQGLNMELYHSST